MIKTKEKNLHSMLLERRFFSFLKLFLFLIYFVPTRDGPKVLRAFWVIYFVPTRDGPKVLRALWFTVLDADVP